VKKKILPTFTTALSSVPLQNILNEFKLNSLTVKKMFRVVYFLSAEVIFLLEKKNKCL
jgi:hypothetical protein